MAESKERIDLGTVDPLLIVGSGDANLRLVQRLYPVRVILRNGALSVLGESAPVADAMRVLSKMLSKARRGEAVEETDIRQWNAGSPGPENSGSPPRVITLDAATVRARTAGQADYIEAIRTYDIVFAIGPAGTGKTFLAVAMAVRALRDHEVERILLVRPAVEAGESLGFLPGDYREKVDPYLRPLYDALSELMPVERMRKLMELGVIEIAPLAYMRGRTLNRAFVILDEAQNTTVGQMKMFLTRLGNGSKAVITGDITQVDLTNPADSGLKCIQPILADVTGIKFMYFTDEDVVRHRLVRDIIKAFERMAAEREAQGAKQRAPAFGTPVPSLPPAFSGQSAPAGEE